MITIDSLQAELTEALRRRDTHADEHQAAMQAMWRAADARDAADTVVSRTVRAIRELGGEPDFRR